MDLNLEQNPKSDVQLEKNFHELFGRVSDQEVERNPALCRQTERLRRSISQFFKTNVEAEVRGKNSRRSIYSIAGEYALLK